MKKILYVFLFLFISVPATAQYNFHSIQDFSSFVCNYYTNPQPEKISSSLDYYINSPYIHVNSIMMVAFYSVLLREDSVLLKSLFDEYETSRSVKEKIFMLQILAEINTTESQQYIFRAQNKWQQKSIQDALSQLKALKPADIYTEPPKDTADLDRLWGTFWASGDSRAIDHIISVLYLWEEGHTTEAATGGAAMWSLTRYAVQHPKILQIIKKQRDVATGTQKSLLQEIINKTEQK